MEDRQKDAPASPEDDDDRKKSAHPPLREERSTVRPPSSSPATTGGKVQAYTDHSHLNPEDMKEFDGISSPSFPSTGGGIDQESSDGGRINNNNKEPPFVAKLHSILSNCAFDDIVSWLPHGRGWRVHQRRAFEEQVIPLYFRHGKYSSFMRQVNGWGFQRINQGPDYGGYYHELFLRGMPHLSSRIRRPVKPLPCPSQPVKRGRAKIDEDSIVVAPNFYRMAEMSPLPTLTRSSAFPPLPRREKGRTDGESGGQAAAPTAVSTNVANGSAGIGSHGAVISSQTTSGNSSGASAAVGMGTNGLPMMPAGGGLNPRNFAQSADPALAAVPSLAPQQLLMQALLAQQHQISQQSQIAQQLQLQNLLNLLGWQAPCASVGNQSNPAVAPADDRNLSHLSSALLELQSQAMGGSVGIPQPQAFQSGFMGDTTGTTERNADEEEKEERRKFN